MTEPSDKPLSDEQLDEYLKGDSDVSLQYRRLHSAEVPAELDNLVLRQAEDAVKPHLSERRRPAWIRWSAPLAVAASALVVLSIVVQTGQRDETLVMQTPTPAQAKRESSANEASLPPPPSVQRAPSGANAPGFIAPAEPAAAPPSAPIYIEPKMAPPPAMDVYVPEFVAPAPATQSGPSAADEVERNAASRRAISADIEARRTYSDPEVWLRDIRRLRHENKQSEADAEWRRFVSAFPDYKVEEHDPARAAKH